MKTYSSIVDVIIQLIKQFRKRMCIVERYIAIKCWKYLLYKYLFIINNISVIVQSEISKYIYFELK